MGSRRRASITSCWNASKSASLRKRCILPTDRFRAWYTCPSCAFREGLVKGSAITLVVSRLQSSFRAQTRAHITARELASPPFEGVYIRAFAGRVTPSQRRI